MLWFRSCSRCKGDLYQNRDMYGPYISCLQCGHYLTAEEEAVLRNTIDSQSIARASNEIVKTLVAVA